MPIVSTKALWTWDLTGDDPVAIGYRGGTPTKTGLASGDLQNFVGVPLVRYGRPPVPVSPDDLLEWIRSAEDWVEQRTGILLTPTAIASPPARSAAQAQSASVAPVTAGGGMLQGIDYDLADAAYDFKFDRSQDNGWLVQSLRYRPLRILGNAQSAIHQMAYVYPLLDQFFQIPVEWFVEDLDFSLLRIVPSANIQVLPLFAMQLSFQGFTDSVPGAVWLQYTAGLTRTDYSTRFRFMRQLVLAQAAIFALNAVQGTLNQGLDSQAVLTDGVQTTYKYRASGVYGDLIQQHTTTRDELVGVAFAVCGPVMETL